MSTKVWLSTRAQVLDPEHATISVFDRGFLYGDSVYETVRTAHGRLIDLDAHLRRLRHSAEGIAFEVPFSDADIHAAISATLDAAANPDSRVRVIVTRGTGPVSLATQEAETPLLVVLVSPLVELSDDERLAGISMVVVDRQSSIRPGLKTGNYLGNILALRQAHDQHADDAIMCNAEGEVAEGTTSNVFMVVGGHVHTPSLASGLLAGITRDVVMRLVADELGLPMTERTILIDELRGADELFTTSSVRGVMPVTTLDGVGVGDGRAGPITRRVIEAYARYLAAAR